MYDFCTYFDQYYLPRGLALYESLKQSCGQFRLWVLCMDQGAVETLQRIQLPEIIIVPLTDLERHDPELLAAKQNRNKLEYYFTCTPALPRYILDRWSDVEMITYLDSDLFFYSDPGPIFDEIGDRSVGIIAHRYPEYLRAELEPYGIYNVGWVSFRRSPDGEACLNWWRERCIEWCYDRYENGRHGDQKYLDVWPEKFKGVAVIEHKGANLAPWNIMNYRYSERDGRLFVDDDELIFFHFTRFKKMQPWLYDTHTARFRARAPKLARKRIYEPYILTLDPIIKRFPMTTGVRYPSIRRNLIDKFKKAYRIWHYSKGIAIGQYLLFVRGKAL